MSREQFEVWAEKNGHDTYRSGVEGAYYFQSTQWSWDIWQEATNAMEAKCAALAAEVQKIKSAIPAVKDIDYDNDNMDDVSLAEDIGFNEAVNLIGSRMKETPATDAFLAEVLASAADEACLKISNAIINCYQDEKIGLDVAATICGDFAAQLRQEEAQ